MKISQRNDEFETSQQKTVIEVQVGDYSHNVEKFSRHYLLPPGCRKDTPRDLKEENPDCKEFSSGKCRVEAISPSQDDPDCNFVHLVHVADASRDRKQFSASMQPVGYRETVSVGGVDKSHVHRSCASFCHYESGQRCKSELVLGLPVLRPVGYGETVLCYGRSQSGRRHRSSVEYQPKLVPGRFVDTCYVLPKRASTTYVSYLDTAPGSGIDGSAAKRRWYSAAINVIPYTASHVLVNRFQWKTDGAEWNVLGEEELERLDEEADDYDDGSTGFLSDVEEASGIEVHRAARDGRDGLYYSGRLGDSLDKTSHRRAKLTVYT